MEKSERMNYKEVADLLWNNVFSKEKSIIWVGSGLSNNYYLCWEDIIDKLCANCGIENNDNFLDIADKCKEANPQKYFDTLYSEYGKNTHQYRSAHLQLFNINTNSILTTNFDSILERTAKYTCNCPVKIYPNLDVTDIQSHSKSLFYIHGQADKCKGKKLIFTSSDFNKEYHAEKGRIRIFINPIFLSYSILFIGYSLSEPMLQNTLKNINEVIYSNKDMKRMPKYLLMHSIRKTKVTEYGKEIKIPDYKEMEKKVVEFEDNYGIKILWYDIMEDDNHFEIENILGTLVDYSSKQETSNSIQGMDNPNG